MSPEEVDASLSKSDGRGGVWSDGVLEVEGDFCEAVSTGAVGGYLMPGDKGVSGCGWRTVCGVVAGGPSAR